MYRGFVKSIGCRRAVVPAALLCGCAAIAAPCAAADTDDEGWISFAPDTGQIVFETAVNGEPARTILDSGADGNSVSAQFAARAGIREDRSRQISITGLHGERSVFLSREFRMEVGDQTIPLRGAPITPGGGYDVILGRGLFELAVVQIDYPNQRVRFLHPDAVEFEGNIEYRSGRSGAPLVEARVHGERAWLLVDTGNGTITMLKRRFVLRNGLESYRIDGVQPRIGGVVTDGVTHVLQLDEVELGPFRLDRFLAGYIPEHNEGLDGQWQRSGSRLNEDKFLEDGILGYELLQNFIVTMDLKRRKIHLELP